MKAVDDVGRDSPLDNNRISKYLEFYDSAFGKKILAKELEFVESKLANSKTVLSVGCGPAPLETKLAELHPTMEIVGLDCSTEMLSQASKSIHTRLGNAQHLAFDDHSFDAVLYITALEFIKNYQLAIREAHRVLKSKGKVLILMLNPQSTYFQERYAKKHSYIRENIRHTNIDDISDYVSQYFSMEHKQYFLGIENQKLVDSTDPDIASLYVLEGVKNE